jgi:hypothetical protein
MIPNNLNFIGSVNRFPARLWLISGLAAVGLIAPDRVDAQAAGAQTEGVTEVSVADAGGAAPVSQADAAALAKKLQNPIASLISVPFQNNFDWGGGPNGDGFQWVLNIQPVIPISLNDDWSLISRTILPVISQTDVAGTSENPSGTQTGLGDTLAAFWFSPKAPGPGGLIWGVGPAFDLPTGTDPLLGSEKWSAGPTAIALKQTGGWTYGALVNHVWSYAGDSGRDDVSETFLEPFVSYTTKTSTTYALDTESAYNWESSQWTVPINLSVSQLVHFGKQPVQFQLGGRVYPEAPDNGPEWGLRFDVTFLFPE